MGGYNQQFQVYRKLNGKFFKNRIPKQKALKIYSEVRLFVTGFDGRQRKYLLPIILKKIYAGMNWSQNTKNLIATGNHKVVKGAILFPVQRDFAIKASPRHFI